MTVKTIKHMIFILTCCIYAALLSSITNNCATDAIELQHTFHLKQLNHRAQRQRRHESYDKFNDVVDNNAAAILMNNVTATDKHKSASATQTTQARTRRQVSDWLIAPNTRWCGRGNTANGTYNQLGGASAADKCCRKHDHCTLFIPAMSNRYELFNYRPYTMSHCACDRRFRTCLKMANDEDANTIGKLFFNMVDTQCFIIKKERICQLRSTDGSGACAREIVRQKAYLKNNKKF